MRYAVLGRPPVGQTGGVPTARAQTTGTVASPVLGDLVAGLDHIRRAPRDLGRVELLACRPAVGDRAVLSEGRFVAGEGLAGDCWTTHHSTATPDGSPDPRAEITVVNWRVMHLIAGPPERVAVAGDQVYVDLDLSEDNLPAGTTLTLGSAALEVTAKPHLGCVKFRARFGGDALRFVNGIEGRQLRLRGINTRILTSGTARVGDVVAVHRP
jgi:hypothetical protein